MPWDHCGKSLTDDTQSCPGCGASKSVWTTRLDKTRLFALKIDFPGDAGAQAAALQTAQDSGSPFCEECQRAANEPDEADDDSGEEPAQEEQPDPDTQAQVDTLKTAADSGSPFCEECQKAANEGQGA